MKDSNQKYSCSVEKLLKPNQLRIMEMDNEKKMNTLNDIEKKIH